MVKVVTIHFVPLALVTLLCFGALLQSRPARADLSSTGRFSTTVPCSPLVVGLDNTHLPLISVRVNASVIATFLVDTGTNSLAVTDAFAKRAKLKPDSTNQAGYPNTINGQTVYTTTLKKMEIGKIVVNKQVVVILPPGKLSGLERPIDGILGSNFFTNIALLWNFQRHELTFLIPGNLTAQELEAFGFNKASGSPITHSANDLWTVEAAFEDSLHVVQKSLIIDTGSVTTTVTPLDSFSLGLKPIEQNVSKWSFDGVEATNTAPVDKFTIGLDSLRGFPVDYGSRMNNKAPATLGMNILWRYHVLIDFPAKKMYLQPTSDAVPTITFNAVPTITFNAVPTITFNAVPTITFNAVPTITFNAVPTITIKPKTPGAATGK